MATKFTGKLAEYRKPRVFPRLGATFFLDEEAKTKAMAKCKSEFDQMYRDCFFEDINNVLLLCDHYGIKKDITPYTFIKLSITLAEELKIPAFIEKKKKGRKEKWTEYNLALLIASVDEKIASRQHENKQSNMKGRVSWACSILVSKEPWKSFISENETSKQGETLRVKYYEAKRSKISLVLGEVIASVAKKEKDLFESLLKNTL